MDEYGEAIVENGVVVGYKTFKDEAVVVKSYVDDSGIKNNLVTVKEFKEGKIDFDDLNDFIQ